MVLRLLFLFLIGFGVVYAAAFVVADLMPPPDKEIVVPVRTDKFGG